MRMRRDDGQILPGLVILMLAIVGLGVVGFQIGKAAILRSEAQTAADAAALAGARKIKRQLEVQWATFGTTDVSAIDRIAVMARMADYRAATARGSIPTIRRRSTAPTSRRGWRRRRTWARTPRTSSASRRAARRGHARG